jgi:hypothetical protein
MKAIKHFYVEPIRQTRPSTCLMCVLAMMVGETEQYVIDWFDPITAPICDEDAYLFLAHHGVFLAMGADLKGFNGGESIQISNDNIINIRVALDTQAAYLVVDSPNNGGKTHAVLWNGKEVFDPLKSEPQPLDGYKVQYMYPFMMTDQRYDRIFKK